MKEFVDLTGASGASYRFRLVPRGVTPLRIAGNWAVLRPRGEGWTVASVGVCDDLSRVHHEVGPLRSGQQAYIRLNVSRTVREAEHADIFAIHAPRAEVVAAE